MKNFKVRFGSRFIWRTFVIWLGSLLIPAILFFLFLYIQYGANVFSVFDGGFDPMRTFGNSTFEQISREISVWVAESPDFENHENITEEVDALLGNRGNHSAMILIRRGDKLDALNTITNDDLKVLQEEFKNVNLGMLPAYGEFSTEINEYLAEENGYVIVRQIDFRYPDGEKGSVYFFIKYTNVSYEIIKVLGNNIMGVALVMMLLNAVGTFVAIKKMSKPIEELRDVMQSYKNDDFSRRLPEVPEKRFTYVINSAVNDMASSLQENQKLREDLELRRTEFFSRVSHDTKTPLASIRAHAEALRDDLIRDEDKKKKYVGNIISKVNVLDNMISELNLYSDLEIGVNQYDFTELNINDYIKDVLGELRYDYEEDKLKLDYQCYDSDQRVSIDVQRFHRVFMNLINNSLKYSDKKPVHIDVTLVSVDKHARITFRDNGMGVDLEEPNVLIESFRRGDESRNPNKAGSGLGLSIIKTIVKKHKGTMNIHSVYGEYFEVEITLPTL
ncbi:HAMP domain-containing histidine kinase [Acidaminobacter sp. JC074]|uniref:sensor histidine kinase n=1 Tax=Acidaminobacter sp. JC074 TaxID=2530199 RepID=UPI001F0D5053|nr:HAMP domain-containing sensor histidine kinase [Acidaminobacter sp. JC074]MCH4887423.1 HAMP domain-containing histidine kinase [Acidaminobacter sp. JC074]